jgi:hypothetical protein
LADGWDGNFEGVGTNRANSFSWYFEGLCIGMFRCRAFLCNLLQHDEAFTSSEDGFATISCQQTREAMHLRREHSGGRIGGQTGPDQEDQGALFSAGFASSPNPGKPIPSPD